MYSFYRIDMPRIREGQSIFKGDRAAKFVRQEDLPLTVGRKAVNQRATLFRDVRVKLLFPTSLHAQRNVVASPSADSGLCSCIFEHVNVARASSKITSRSLLRKFLQLANLYL